MPISIGQIASGGETIFPLPPHIGAVTVTVNASNAPITSQDAARVVLTSAVPAQAAVVITFTEAAQSGSGSSLPPATALITSSFTASPQASAGDIRGSSANGATSAFSGTLGVGVLGTLLNITGAGWVPLLNAASSDATARTVRMRVTVDGTVVFDATSATVGTAGRGIFAAGMVTNTGVVEQAQPIRFNTSLRVEAATSLAENGGVTVSYILM